MRVVAIVQARMGSTRLQGKVLRDLDGRTMLARVVERLQRTTTLDAIVVATTIAADDDALVDHVKHLGVAWFRGDRDDVLSRYVGAAREAAADVVVRITSDCPLVDPEIVDRVVHAVAGDVDYASNTHRRTFPRGLDVEALHADTLQRIARLAKTPATREHVTSYVMEHPSLFRIASVASQTDDSDLRWTVDTEEDLALVRALYESGAATLPYRELVAIVRARPELQANAHVAQKSWQHHA